MIRVTNILVNRMVRAIVYQVNPEQMIFFGTRGAPGGEVLYDRHELRTNGVSYG